MVCGVGVIHWAQTVWYKSPLGTRQLVISHGGLCTGETLPTLRVTRHGRVLRKQCIVNLVNAKSIGSLLYMSPSISFSLQTVDTSRKTFQWEILHLNVCPENNCFTGNENVSSPEVLAKLRTVPVNPLLLLIKLPSGEEDNAWRSNHMGNGIVR